MSSNKCNLTFPQNNIYMVEKFNDSSKINTIAGFLKIEKNFKEEICLKIINQLIKSNDALRIKIKENENVPYQIIENYAYQDIQCIDMSNSTDIEITNYFEKSVDTSFNLFCDKLYDFTVIRSSKDSGYIFMKLHHIISDAWTFGQVINQLVKMYDNYVNNIDEEKNIPSYLEYICSETEYISSDKYLKDENFWKEYLNNISSPISIKTASTKLSNKAKRYSAILDKNLNDKIIKYTTENRVSAYTLFLAVLSTYIYRIKDSNDFVIGTPTLNRANFKEKQMLGMFVSTMPMRIKIQENMKFLDLVKSIGLDTMSMFRHQKYPFNKILENIHKTTDIKGKIFNIMLSYQNARADIGGSDKYSTKWIFSKAIQDELEIHLLDMDNNGTLTINYDYLTDLFEDIEIEYLHTRIMAILENAIEDIDVNVENICIMSNEEKKKILYEFNDTTTDYPKDKTVIELFEEQVEKTPNNIALVFENSTLTYKELNEKANQLAHYLSEEKNIHSDDVVGVMIDKSFNLIIAILGILKVGATYLPLDSNLLDDRKEYILNDSKVNHVISDLNIENCKYFNINDVIFNKYSDKNKYKVSDLNSTVYIMYTSGTTGKPKGVMIKNQNIIRLVKNTNYIKFNENDKMVQTGSSGFDASTLEYWGTLLNGASLYLISHDCLLNPIELKKYLLDNDITIMWLTSPLYNQFADFDIMMFKNLRVLLIGGDVLSIKHVNKLLDNCKNVKVINGYGPTENTTFSTCHIINKKYINNIPIGKPISNSKCYILDKKYRLLPINTNGELIVGGDGVSKGYVNKDELTKEKFINIEYDNNIVYKTGDNAYWNNNGEIEFLGRLDNQVKIRGFRVELGEINQCILLNPNIKESFINVEKLDEQKILVAYYSCNVDYTLEELIIYLRKHLSNYMIPTQFVKLDKLPLNNNGKVDKNKLICEKDKHIIKINKNKTYVGEYKKIYDLFSLILNKTDIDENDNFFDIGGDSLLAVKFVTKAMGQNIIITYSDLYKYSTIKSLSDMLISKNEKKSISEPIKQFNYTKINEILANNIYNDKINYDMKENIGNILLAGATGFLGAHILDAYMKNEKGKIYCIIRPNKNEDPTFRLKEKMLFFFGEKYISEIGKRIIVIEGDITNSRIITNEDEYDVIVKNVDTVINSAAHVKHFGKLNLFEEINVRGTKNLVDFCLLNKKKFIHLSTLSVSGNILETGQVEQTDILSNTIYDESNFYISQNLDNVYAYTKFMSEKIVYDAIVKDKLNAKIMRMGNLTGRYSDGKFQPNVEDNAFANRLKTIIELGVIPQNILDFYLEFTPIDYAADAVLKLSKTSEMFNTFHIFNHKHANMRFVDEIFKKMGINLKHITKDEMTELLNYYMNDEEGYKKIQGIVLDINKNKELEYKPNIIVKSNFSIEVLKKNGFEWPDIKYEYIKKYIDYLYEINFLKKG